MNQINYNDLGTCPDCGKTLFEESIHTCSPQVVFAKKCSCEHWQICPICMPELFDANGKRIPPEPPPLQKALNEIRKLREALELIAAPKRPDGTWNRDRAACQQLAKEALCPG